MIPTVNDLLPRIVALMQAENVSVREPVSTERFENFERQWNVELPSDMREFYARMDGTSKDHSITEFLFCIWPLSEVMPISNLLTEPVYADYRNIADASRILCFSDYMINSDVFALRTFGPLDVISVCNGQNAVAFSFTDFLNRLMVNPISLM